MACGQLARFAECRKQIALADRLVITKTDLADAAQSWRSADRRAGAAQSGGGDLSMHHGLDALRPLLDSWHGCAAPPASRHRQCAAIDAASGAAAEHSPMSPRWRFTLDEPVDWSAFSVWLSLLLHAHGEKILRFKALLDVAGWPARWCSTAFIISFIRRSICRPGRTVRARPASW